MNTVKRCDVVISKETGGKHEQVTQSLITLLLTQMNVQQLLRKSVHSFKNRLTFLKDRRIIAHCYLVVPSKFYKHFWQVVRLYIEGVESSPCRSRTLRFLFSTLLLNLRKF